MLLNTMAFIIYCISDSHLMPKNLTVLQLSGISSEITSSPPVVWLRPHALLLDMLWSKPGRNILTLKVHSWAWKKNLAKHTFNRILQPADAKLRKAMRSGWKLQKPKVSRVICQHGSIVQVVSCFLSSRKTIFITDCIQQKCLLELWTPQVRNQQNSNENCPLLRS